MEKQSNEVFKMWASKPMLMEVEDPFVAEYRMKSKMLYDQYQANLKSEVPSWMTEKMFMAIENNSRENNRKSFITKICNYFKK